MNNTDYIELTISNLLDDEDILSGVSIPEYYLNEFIDWIETGVKIKFQGYTFAELMEQDN